MPLKIPALLDAILEATAAEASAKARITIVRATLEDEARRRFVEEGAAPSWNAPGAGKVRFDPPGEPAAVVADADAFGKWVAEQYPTEVVQSLEVPGEHVAAAAQALTFAGVPHEVVDAVRSSWSRTFLEAADVEEDTPENEDDGPATYTVWDPESGEAIPGLSAHRSPGKLVVSLDRDRRTLALEDARAQADAIIAGADPDAPDLADLNARRQELEGWHSGILSAYAKRLELSGSGTKAELAERIARTEARLGRRDLFTAAELAADAGLTSAPEPAEDVCGYTVDHDTSGANPNECRRCGAELEPIEDSTETEEEATAQALTAPSVAGILALGSREALRRFAKAHDVPAHGTKQDLAIRLSASGKTVDAITRWLEDNTTQEPTP